MHTMAPGNGSGLARQVADLRRIVDLVPAFIIPPTCYGNVAPPT
jgi:hypothetical protein